MKKIRMAFFALATLTLLATSTGCGGGGGGSDDDDGDDETPVAEGDNDFDESLLTQDCYQTAHVKVENVPGGLKFTITRPENKYYDPRQVIREADGWYEWVDEGNGDYVHDHYEYVGAGKGDRIRCCDHYTVAREYDSGDYIWAGYKYVGEGKGIFKKVPKANSGFDEYVGKNKGDYEFDSRLNLVYVGGGDLWYQQYGNGGLAGTEPSYSYSDIITISGAPKLPGDYNLEIENWDEGYKGYACAKIKNLSKVEDGSGKYKFVKGEFYYVGDGQGDYISGCTNTGNIFVYVGEGIGDFIIDENSRDICYVGQGKGDIVQEMYIYAGNGKGNFKFYPDRYGTFYTGANKGSFRRVEGYDCEWVDWDYDNNKGNGDYVYVAKYVGEGNGYLVENPICNWVGEKNGDYKEIYSYVGDGNGDFVRRDNKIYGGVGGVHIGRYEPTVGGNNGRTTRAIVAIDNNVDTWTCFYPLCEAGERYIFNVEFQPYEDNYHREAVLHEWVSITAQGGIGDIDYSTINENRRLSLTYDGEKPTSTISNHSPSMLPASATSIASVIEYFAGTTEWKPGTTYWIAGYRQDASKMVFDKDPCMEEIKTWASPVEVEKYRTSRCFNATVRSKGKNQFFSEQFYKFQLPEAQGITEFRTLILRSNFAYMN